MVVVDALLLYNCASHQCVQSLSSNGLFLHYEFCKAIALYWINNVEAMKIYRCSGASLSVSSSAPKMLFQSLASMSSMSAMDGDLTIGSSVGSGAPTKASQGLVIEAFSSNRCIEMLIGQVSVSYTCFINIIKC